MKFRVITAHLPVHKDKEYEWDASAALERIKQYATDDTGAIDLEKFEKAFLLRSGDDLEKDFHVLIADVIDGELRAIPAASKREFINEFLEEGSEAYGAASQILQSYNPVNEHTEEDPPPDPQDDPEVVPNADKRYLGASITEKSNDGTFTAIASSAIEDRHGEVINQDGWNLKNFKKNPVLLWAHDHTVPAIGVASKVWVADGKLMFKGKWQDVTEMGRAAKLLVQDGIINSFSVGFIPLEMDGWTYTKQELLEISLVNVPANPEAMMLAYKSLQEAGVKKETIKGFGIPVEVLDNMSSLQKTVDDLSRKYDAIETLVKAKTAPELPAAPSTSTTVSSRQSLVKTIAKASDKILAQEKTGSLKQERVDLVKVIKRAAEKLSVSHKEQLQNGKNS